VEVLYERIDSLCKQHGISGYRLCKDINISPNTLTELRKGRRDGISGKNLVKISKYFNVPVAYLVGEQDVVENATAVSSGDARLISAYHRASPADRAIIDNIVDRYADAEPVVQMKVVPLFGTAAAAGPGEFDTGLPWEDYEVPQDSAAEFAVRISGDSMSPELEDGQIALCVKRRPAIGDLAVMMVNGSMLVKQFITDNYNIYLRSLNRKRKDCDYDIMGSGNDTVLCFGIVLVDHKIPLVD